jgi:diguanylate cyclase (GGDEF)-like protein/PAS domain S-box-containing protein
MINSMLSLLVLGFLFVNYKDRIHGIDYWIISQMLSIAAFMVSVLRVVLPSEVAILVSNALHLSAILLLSEGLARYLSTRFRYRLDLVLVGLSMTGLVFYTVNQPMLQARTLILHATLLVLSLRMVFKFRSGSINKTQRASLIMSLTLAFYAVVAAYNLAIAVWAPVPENYLEGNLYTIIGHVALIILTVMLTYAEILLVSDKLLHKVIASEQKLNLVFDHSPTPLIVTHFGDGRIYNANASLLTMFGYTLDEVIGKTTMELNMWADAKHRDTLLTEIAKKRHIEDFEVVLRTRDGSQRICKLSALVIQLSDEKDLEDYLLVNVSDVTQDVTTREDLKHLATHDHLTGLANRTLFYDRFDSDKARANRHQHQLAVIALDLNRLKTINDTYGHPVGDMALVHLANQISSVLRKSDTFARFGGDEFCILLDEIESTSDVESVVKKILDRVSEPMIHHETPVSISVSMGIALYPQDAETADELIQRADMALYTVKRERQSAYAYFRRPQ